MSHSEYCFNPDHIKKTSDNEIKHAMEEERFKISQLVLASTKENARIAVINSIEENGQFLVLRCRIDDLIIGE